MTTLLNICSISVKGDDSQKVEEYRYFGALKNNFFTIAIAGGESKYLRWNYHAYNQWRYREEKSSVKIIRVAEWKPQ